MASDWTSEVSLWTSVLFSCLEFHSVPSKAHQSRVFFRWSNQGQLRHFVGFSGRVAVLWAMRK